MFPRTLLILITSQFSFPAFRGKNDMLCKTWILFMIYCKRFWRDTWWGLKRKQKRFQFCVQSSDLQILILIPLVYNWTKSIWQKIWKIFVTRCDFLGWKPSHWKHPIHGNTRCTAQDTQWSTLDTCCTNIERSLWIIANETMLSTMYTSLVLIS